jgi:nicotinate-nucleotide adenylyltransferase
MARLAVAEFPCLIVDDREVRRAAPSYTVTTLEELRAELGATPLAWLIGADSFCSLPTWHRWRELFALTHFVVTPRPGYELEACIPADLRDDWAQRRTTNPAALRARAAGAVLVHTVAPQPISASELRERLSRGAEVRGLLPVPVMNYIRSHHLYRSA